MVPDLNLDAEGQESGGPAQLMWTDECGVHDRQGADRTRGHAKRGERIQRPRYFGKGGGERWGVVGLIALRRRSQPKAREQVRAEGEDDEEERNHGGGRRNRRRHDQREGQVAEENQDIWKQRRKVVDTLERWYDLDVAVTVSRGTFNRERFIGSFVEGDEVSRVMRGYIPSRGQQRRHGHGAGGGSKPESFLVLDNAKIHKGNAVADAVRQEMKGTEIVFVPPYSPDLNGPIEASFRQLKALIRRRFWATVAAAGVADGPGRRLTDLEVAQAYRDAVQIRSVLSWAMDAGYVRGWHGLVQP